MQGTSARPQAEDVRPTCPAWCIIPAEQHADDTPNWEGGAVHWSARRDVVDISLEVVSTTEADGSLAEDPTIKVNEWCDLTAGQARWLASELVALADMIEATT